MIIPRDSTYPIDAGQCNDCGGFGCATCENRGWLPSGHPQIRRCALKECSKPIAPYHVAVYCSNKCASLDA